MSEQKHTKEELRQWQALPLSIKVRMSMERIRMWVREFGESGVYVSFSGGKDSAVLSHLVDRTIPGNEIPRLFVNTGLEYPEIVAFVKKEPRLVMIRPEMNFKKVIETFGYPFISKEVSDCVYTARLYLNNLAGQNGRNKWHQQCLDRVRGQGLYAKREKTGKIENDKEFAEELQRRMDEKEGGANFRLARMFGILTDGGKIQPANTIDKTNKSMFSQERWNFFLDEDAPWISGKCCTIMKKKPAHSYAHKTGRVAITGEMAAESKLRAQKWLQHGCNAFDTKEPKSTPMAFWTDQDVLRYIKQNNLEICSVYGDIVEDDEKGKCASGQLELLSDGTIVQSECQLKTTGCKRTGCMFCGYGCHLEKPGKGRFERMKETHPKIYDWIMRPKEQGGLNYKRVIDWINEHGGTHIRY